MASDYATLTSRAFAASCSRRSAKSFSRCRCSSTTAAGALATKFWFASFFRTVTNSASAFCDLPAEALPLGVEIDQAFERQIKLAERRERGRRSLGRLVARRQIEPLRVEQDAQDGRFFIAQRSFEGRSTKTIRLFEAMLKSRRKPATGTDRFVFRIGELFVVRREAVVLLEFVIERLRPARELNCSRPLLVRQLGVETEPMPEFLRDERHEWDETSAGRGRG